MCGNTCSTSAIATDDALPGQVEQQAVDREGVEPVSVFADDLGDPKPTEIRILANQSKIVADADAGGCHAKHSAYQRVGWRMLSSQA